MTIPRTSETHPLRIDDVSVPGCDGRIGMTLCPGKRQRGALTGSWDRDLTADTPSIRKWAPGIVVSLVEAHEFDELGVPELGQEMTEAGALWLHLPIVDQGVPDPRWEIRWTYFGELVRQQLRRGGHVLLHCKGGLGRTGLVAARLLVEFGMDANQAIHSVRQARHRTIETIAQEDYVRACRCVPRAGEELSPRARTLGCLIGGAIGDAFGYQVEFDDWKSIQSKHGPDGITGFVEDDSPIIVSDDTQMTLFTMEGLLRALDAGNTGLPQLVEEVRLAYLDWGHTQRLTLADWAPAGTLWQRAAMQALRAPGTTCLNALLDHGAQGSSEHSINDSKGCGGVMRVAPLGLLTPWLDLDQIEELGQRTSALTHTHPLGFQSAGLFARMIAQEFLGASSPDTDRASPLEDQAPFAQYRREIHDFLATTSTSPPTTQERVDFIESRLGQGWVAEEAWAIAVFAHQASTPFLDVIRMAANHSGDSDSTASLAGQLHGAGSGLQGIPERWVQRIDVLDEILKLAHRYFELTE